MTASDSTNQDTCSFVTDHRARSISFAAWNGSFDGDSLNGVVCAHGMREHRFIFGGGDFASHLMKAEGISLLGPSAGITWKPYKHS